jgi:hypothetical protein
MQFLITETLVKAFQLIKQPELISLINLETVELLTVDINSMLAIPDVQSYLKLLPTRLLVPHKIETIGNTVYVGDKDHSNYAYRIYDKMVERKDKNQYDKLTPTEGGFTYDKIRIELILNNRELQSLGLYDPSRWTIQKTEELYSTYIARLRIMKNRNEDLSKLSEVAAGYYCRWRYCGDPADVIIANKNTRTRYRAEILEALGVDIYKPYSEENAPPVHLLLEPKELEMNGVDRQETMVRLHRLANTLHHERELKNEAINTLFPRPTKCGMDWCSYCPKFWDSFSGVFSDQSHELSQQTDHDILNTDKGTITTAFLIRPHVLKAQRRRPVRRVNPLSPVASATSTGTCETVEKEE